jgi:hypothetical protein
MAGLAALGLGVAIARSRNGADSVPEGWSERGADWFNSLPWEDALYLLTLQSDDTPDEQRLGPLRESYSKATGYAWD